MKVEDWIDAKAAVPEAGGQDPAEWEESDIDEAKLSATVAVWCVEGKRQYLHYPLRRAFYDHAEGIWYDDDSGGVMDAEVTHWQPLCPPTFKQAA